MRVDLGARHRDVLPDITIRVVSNRRPPMLASVLRRLTALGPKLDLFPVLPMVRMSGPAKSYHFGSTFPHGNGSDLLGRVGHFRNVHLIDGSVLPSVPSTTFTLTVMANAHRIVSESRHV
jgi:choline dehydrogenase-like flavoprotein